MVAAALEDGTLTRRRYESWRKLQREMDWMAARKDARLRAERVKRWKKTSPAWSVPRSAVGELGHQTLDP